MFRFEDAARAAAAAAALAPENGAHCRMTLEGAVLVVAVDEARLGSVAVSVDDLLACVSAAVRAQDGAARD